MRRLRDEGHAPQIVDAVRVVGVIVRVEHAVDALDARVQQLLAQVGRRIDQHASCARRLPNRSTSSAQRRRRFFGLVGSQAPQTLPTRGTPPEEPQPRIVNAHAHAAPAPSRGVLA